MLCSVRLPSSVRKGLGLANPDSAWGGQQAGQGPWVKDCDAPACFDCRAPFSLLRRRHHCRLCGKIFCHECCDSRMPLPRWGHTQPVRVCCQCARQCNIAENLSRAIRQENEAVVQSIIQGGHDVNFHIGLSAPLTQAAAQGSTRLAELLLQGGAEVCAAVAPVDGPIVVRCSSCGHSFPYVKNNGVGNSVGSKQCRCTGCSRLTDVVPLVDSQSNFAGVTALHAAVSGKADTELVLELIGRGADVNARTLHGTTPLMLASQRGDVDVIKALISSGADINQGTVASRSTPLHFAVSSGNADAITVLLQAGADPTLSDAHGLTALQRADQSGDPAVIAAVATTPSVQLPSAYATPAPSSKAQNGSIHDIVRQGKSAYGPGSSVGTKLISQLDFAGTGYGRSQLTSDGETNAGKNIEGDEGGLESHSHRWQNDSAHLQSQAAALSILAKAQVQ